MNAAVMSQ